MSCPGCVSEWLQVIFYCSIPNQRNMTEYGWTQLVPIFLGGCLLKATVCNYWIYCLLDLVGFVRSLEPGLLDTLNGFFMAWIYRRSLEDRRSDEGRLPCGLRWWGPPPAIVSLLEKSACSCQVETNSMTSSILRRMKCRWPTSTSSSPRLQVLNFEIVFKVGP